MDISSSKSCYLLSMTLLFLSCLGNNLSSTNSEVQDLIYRHCANQTLSDPTGSLPQILPSLFHELVEQSSESKFYETSVGDDNIAISGLFQCRNDLSNDQCFNCVNRLPKLSNIFCGSTIPALIHLSGCYLHYKDDGFQISRLELQHKSCSESTAVSGGFEEVRYGAFAALERCVINAGNGFCDMSYESMHVMAQCQGNLEGCDCGECVSNAVQIAQDECGESISGEVYLDSCLMTYTYSGNEIPSYSNQGTTVSGKLVAIVAGGGVALLFVVLFFYLCKSSRKKCDDNYV